MNAIAFLNLRFLMSLLTVLTWCGVAQAASPTNDIGGNWKGFLEAGSVKLRVMFKITKESHGLVATMDSPDQGGKDMPVDQVTFKDGKLQMRVSMVQGNYEGVLDKAGSKLAGRWVQSGQVLPLSLERTTSTNFPPELEKFSSADLAANKKAAEQLAGTWDGRLPFGSADLRLRLKISATSEGRAVGTLDSLDQGVSDIPVSAITLQDGALRFEVRGFAAVYNGKVTGGGSTLEGNWAAGGGPATALSFRKAAAAAGK